MKKLRNLGLRLLIYTTLILGGFYYTVNYKSIKANYIRKQYSQYVVKVTNKERSSGGTGFHIETEKGNIYILTNAHVCEHSQENGWVYVEDEDRTFLPRKVIQISDYTDLCLVEAVPNSRGKLIKRMNISFPTKIAVLGHPLLQPTTQTEGEITGNDMIDVIDHMGHENCSLPKHKKGEINVFIFKMPVCEISIDSYYSTAQVLPGNSGSPVYDEDGNIVGIVFASDGFSNRAFIVNLNEIIKFLNPY